MPQKADHDTTTPYAGPDAALLTACSELFTISNLLAAIDAGELDIDSIGLAAATGRYWVLVTDVTATPAITEPGRIAKVRVAAIASRIYRNDSPRVLALVGSALHDVLTAWEDAAADRRVRP